MFKTKLLSLISGIMFLCGLNVIPAYALQNQQFQYSIQGNQVIINKYIGPDINTGNSAIVNIPAEIDGYPVTIIDQKAFEKTAITGVAIPESIVDIRKEAFKDSEITTINIPNSVRTIGDDAFVNTKKLTSITLPESLTSIGNKTFEGSGVQTVILPEVMTVIPEATFRNSSLTNIQMSANMFTIGKNAFEGCKNITGLTLPNTISAIDEGAFKDCSNMQTINIPTSLIELSDNLFYGCESLQTITIPGTVQSIGDKTFAKCKSLTEIILPNSIINLNSMVSECDNLQTVMIPSTTANCNFDGIGEKCPKLIFYVEPNSYAAQALNELTGISFIQSVPSDLVCSGYVKNSIGKAAIPNSITNDNVSWKYIKDDGTYPQDEWVQLGSNWYFFNNEGYAERNKWIDDTYYVTADGSMLVDGEAPDGQKVNNKGERVGSEAASQVNQPVIQETTAVQEIPAETQPVVQETQSTFTPIGTRENTATVPQQTVPTTPTQEGADSAKGGVFFLSFVFIAVSVALYVLTIKKKNEDKVTEKEQQKKKLFRLIALGLDVVAVILIFLGIFIVQ